MLALHGWRTDGYVLSIGRASRTRFFWALRLVVMTKSQTMRMGISELPDISNLSPMFVAMVEVVWHSWSACNIRLDCSMSTVRRQQR